MKTSCYAIIPDNAKNRWPVEVDLRAPFEALGTLMNEMAELLMYKIDLLGDRAGIRLDKDACLGQMLYYRKGDYDGNPQWCGARFDHSLFTAILPAVYFIDGKQIPEPMEAGLFIRTSKDAPFKKIIADDLDIMMFQVGEFGQLVKNDGICATEHRVHKAIGAIERYTLAIFIRHPTMLLSALPLS